VNVDDPLLAAVLGAIDPAALRRGIERATARPAASEAPTGEQAAGPIATETLRRVLLADLLDDSILNARPGDTSFPLRLFLGQIGVWLTDDTAFALASGLNFFFRAEMDEEWRMRTGIEVSRLYYRFVAEKLAPKAPRDGGLEPAVLTKVSPLLAAMLNSELARVKLEAIDHAATFDSSLHERDAGSNAAAAAIQRPSTFLCRVAATGVVRVKAAVIT
jgi:hypothetical protein